jgi:hypothetical protein
VLLGKSGPLLEDATGGQERKIEQDREHAMT